MNPLLSTSINTINLKMLTIQDLQEQLLLTVSSEKFSDPSNPDKLNQLTKEKGILDIMNNTTMDKVNHQVSVKYLYNSNLSKLGENHYEATKRIITLHNKIADKPEMAADIDKYILEQVTKRNYVEIDIQEAWKNKHQLHFVGYNFVVSATTSFTKVRIKTDSSMYTQSSLSLNEVTQPAHRDVPSLRGILVGSRCHPFYAVYDIKKFLRSVCSSDNHSFLRIVCIPSNSFSSPPTPTPPGSTSENKPFPSETVPL